MLLMKDLRKYQRLVAHNTKRDHIVGVERNPNEQYNNEQQIFQQGDNRQTCHNNSKLWHTHRRVTPTMGVTNPTKRKGWNAKRVNRPQSEELEHRREALCIQVACQRKEHEVNQIGNWMFICPTQKIHDPRRTHQIVFP